MTVINFPYLSLPLTLQINHHHVNYWAKIGKSFHNMNMWPIFINLCVELLWNHKFKIKINYIYKKKIIIKVTTKR